MKEHIVKQGEHVSSIAKKYGFADYRQIWDHGDNAKLKQKRKNPNVLLPGDHVVIPDRDDKQVPGATNQRHTFKMRRPPLHLRLKMEKGYGGAVDNIACELLVEFDLFKVTSDEEGGIEHLIPKDAQQAYLTVKDTLAVKGRQVPIDIRVPIKIGFLNPVEDPSGQKARLVNLGYYRAADGEADEAIDEEEFAAAVEEFQCEHGLIVNGKCDDVTQAKLKEVHGC
jgi:N-acetylmuramoyl-L-alanine amidase